MSTTLITVLVLVGLFVFLILIIAIKKMMKFKKQNKIKPKQEKKIEKEKKIKIKKGEEKVEQNKGSLDIAQKFLFRKELKFLIIVNKILPKGYVAFPKVGVDLVLTPIGNTDLYNSLHGKYIDLVIFEEETMKPKIAIDIYDGSLGDEPLDIESPEVLNALKIAEFPLISFKVKTQYTDDEIKNPIFKVLGIKEENKTNDERNMKK